MFCLGDMAGIVSEDASEVILVKWDLELISGFEVTKFMRSRESRAMCYFVISEKNTST